MRVETEIEETELEGDYGEVSGLIVTCTRCGHQVEVYGTSDASARRGAVMLTEECPEGGNNFYVVEGDDTPVRDEKAGHDWGRLFNRR